jgi:DNA-binding NtrC family response regulator
VLTTEALAELLAYDFPGNVRELANILERVLVRCHQPTVPIEQITAALAVEGISSIRSLPGQVPAAPEPSPAGPASSLDTGPHPGDWPLALAELEKLAILEALRRVSGNRTHAARLLGISLRTLRNKLRALRMAGALAADGQLLPGGPSRQLFGDTTVARHSQQESAA